MNGGRRCGSADLDPAVHASALVLVPFLVARFRPRSVVHLGSGSTWWAAVFEALGVPALRLGGPEVAPGTGLVRHHLECDLAEPLPDVGRFDIALFLGLGEPTADVDLLAAGLCSLSDRAVLLGEREGTGGPACHEGSRRRWIDVLRGRGFAVDATFGERFAADRRMAWWYRRSMVVAERIR